VTMRVPASVCGAASMRLLSLHFAAHQGQLLPLHRAKHRILLLFLLLIVGCCCCCWHMQVTQLAAEGKYDLVVIESTGGNLHGLQHGCGCCDAGNCLQCPVIATY
jgi:hypothetical protein